MKLNLDDLDTYIEHFPKAVTNHTKVSSSEVTVYFSMWQLLQQVILASNTAQKDKTTGELLSMYDGKVIMMQLLDKISRKYHFDFVRNKIVVHFQSGYSFLEDLAFIKINSVLPTDGNK
jgi:hypothetical protein